MKFKNLIFTGSLLVGILTFSTQLVAREIKGPISMDTVQPELMPVRDSISKKTHDNGDISYEADLVKDDGAVAVTKHKAGESFSGVIQFSPSTWIHMMDATSVQNWYNYLQKEYDKQKQKIL